MLDASEATAYAGVSPPLVPKETKLTLFPNPAGSSIQVAGLAPTVAPYTIEIWEGVTGRRMANAPFAPGANGTLTVPLPPSLPAGLYLLRATAGGNTVSAPFLKIP